MAITAGAVTLNSHISWRGFFNSAKVAGSEDTTLRGRPVINRLPNANDDIVWEAIEEDDVRKGYFIKSELEALEVYRDAGTIIILNYHGTITQAVIRMGGINVEKVLWKSEFDEEEKYIGSITFMRA